MKKFLSLALILCFVLSVVPFYTVEADADTVYTEAESNNVIGDADTIDITDGVIVKGSFTDNEDCDFFKFTINRGGRVDIKSSAYCKGEHSSITACISYGLDYETDYPEIEEADYGYADFNSDLGYGYGSKAHYLAEGTYYLKFKGCGTRNVEYSLSINYEPIEDFSEPNDVIGQATNISIGDNYRGIISAKYDRGRDVDFFRLYSPASKKYNITVDCSASKEKILISVHDAEGNFLGLFEGKDYYFEDPDYVDAGKKETFTGTMPAGDVYIKIIGGQGAEYTISVSSAGSNNTDDDNDNISNDDDNSNIDGDNTDNDEYMNMIKVNSLINKAKLKVTTSKTSKKNIKIKVGVKTNKNLVNDIENMGYTVKYKFYRSTKNISKYKVLKTKNTNTFINGSGKKGAKYYYKAKILVYDNGTLIAQTALKQCSYSSKVWSK